MAKSNPTRPNAPDDEAGLGDDSPQSIGERGGPVLEDPRAVSAMDRRSPTRVEGETPEPEKGSAYSPSNRAVDR